MQAMKASPLEFLKVFSGHQLFKQNIINTKTENIEIDSEIKLKCIL